MQMLPNWYHGFLPSDLWPDRPREFFITELDVIPLAASVVTPREIVFSKRTDVIVFGGCVIITDTAGAVLNNPRSGVFSRCLVSMYNAAGNEVYTPLDNTGLPVVPLEHLFAMWGWHVGGQFVNMGAKQPAYWTQPVVVRKGGALTLNLLDLSGTVRHLRLGFWIGLMYEQRENVA